MVSTSDGSREAGEYCLNSTKLADENSWMDGRVYIAAAPNNNTQSTVEISIIQYLIESHNLVALTEVFGISEQQLVEEVQNQNNLCLRTVSLPH
jgi:hypothetical protein